MRTWFRCKVSRFGLEGVQRGRCGLGVGRTTRGGALGPRAGAGAECLRDAQYNERGAQVAPCPNAPLGTCGDGTKRSPRLRPQDPPLHHFCRNSLHLPSHAWGRGARLVQRRVRDAAARAPPSPHEAVRSAPNRSPAPGPTESPAPSTFSSKKRGRATHAPGGAPPKESVARGSGT